MLAVQFDKIVFLELYNVVKDKFYGKLKVVIFT